MTDPAVERLAEKLYQEGWMNPNSVTETFLIKFEKLSTSDKRKWNQRAEYVLTLVAPLVKALERILSGMECRCKELGLSDKDQLTCAYCGYKEALATWNKEIGNDKKLV